MAETAMGESPWPKARWVRRAGDLHAAKARERCRADPVNDSHYHLMPQCIVAIAKLSCAIAGVRCGMPASREQCGAGACGQEVVVVPHGREALGGRRPFDGQGVPQRPEPVMVGHGRPVRGLFPFVIPAQAGRVSRQPNGWSPGDLPAMPDETRLFSGAVASSARKSPGSRLRGDDGGERAGKSLGVGCLALPVPMPTRFPPDQP